MTPNEYQALARRTRAPQNEAAARMAYNGPANVTEKVAVGIETKEVVRQVHVEMPIVSHGIVGVAGEAGELCTALEHFIWYKKELDVTNIKEELGDLMWYVAEVCDGLGIELESVMKGNIAKLQKRFPEKFDFKAVLEENRDRTAESVAMMKAMDDGPSYENDLTDSQEN